MDLFIKNWDNFASITLYQFIQASHMTYKEFKKMVTDRDKEMKMTMNLPVLEFVEPVIKKYWTEKDVHKFPDYNKPKPFKGNNKNTKGECKTCLPWNVTDKKYIEGVDTEYAAVDFCIRMIFRLITTIELESAEYKLSLDDLWNLSKPARAGKAYTKDKKPIAPETMFVLDNVKTEALNRYLEYMSRFTDTIPLIAYEIVFFDDDEKYDYHVFTYIREGKHKLVNLNSNLEPKREKDYHALVARKTSGNWKKEPPVKVLEHVRDGKDMPTLVEVMENPKLAIPLYKK